MRGSATTGRFGTAEPGSLRRLAARGTLINAGFDVGIGLLGLLRGFILAGFLTRADYGLWGIVTISLISVAVLKQAGIGDKYVQQDDADEEAAFQRAFTLEALLTLVCVALLLALLPLFAVLYGLPRIMLPGVVLALALLLTIFHAPLWVPYRQMDFRRQRLLQSVDPVFGFLVAVGLAVAGAGVWAFVGGVVAGWAGAAVVATFTSPYRLAWRYDREAAREYARFSGPLLIAGGAGFAIAWSAAITAKFSVGLGAVGVIVLADNITSFTQRVDDLITGSLYPAICAVRDRPALMYESLVKSNRLALMWAVPLGLAITLFAGDLVRFGIGPRWQPAVIVLQVFGIAAALNHVGFNWTAYLRAIGRTRPVAVSAAAAVVTFAITGIPLLIWFGLRGFAVGVVLQGVAAVGVRIYYLRELFPAFDFLRQAARAFLPALPGVGLVLLLRGVEPAGRTLPVAAAELAAYLTLGAVCTWRLEGRLLREAARLVAPQPHR